MKIVNALKRYYSEQPACVLMAVLFISAAILAALAGLVFKSTDLLVTAAFVALIPGSFFFYVTSPSSERDE